MTSSYRFWGNGPERQQAKSYSGSNREKCRVCIKYLFISRCADKKYSCKNQVLISLPELYYKGEPVP